MDQIDQMGQMDRVATPELLNPSTFTSTHEYMQCEVCAAHFRWGWDFTSYSLCHMLAIANITR